MDSRCTIVDLIRAKQEGRKIVAISCYDYTSALIMSQSDIDMIIVGDSAAQVMLGYDSTLPVTMDFLVTITKAVRKGAPNIYLVADMPFLSYQVTRAEAIRNAGRFIVDSDAQMVKIEVNSTQTEIVKAISNAGIAVMAHIGIRPQSIGRIGRFKAEGTTAEMGYELIQLAERLFEAGAKAFLIEGTAAEVAEIITQRFEIPVISCGSGGGCDGQVLVEHDVLGLTQGRMPKFSQSFTELTQPMIKGIDAYVQAVRDRAFPDSEHSYHMKAGELETLRELIDHGL